MHIFLPPIYVKHFILIRLAPMSSMILLQCWLAPINTATRHTRVTSSNNNNTNTIHWAYNMWRTETLSCVCFFFVFSEFGLRRLCHIRAIGYFVVVPWICIYWYCTIFVVVALFFIQYVQQKTYRNIYYTRSNQPKNTNKKKRNEA